MIKDLISKALSSEGAGLLEGIGLAPDKQKKALDLANKSVIGGLTESLSAGKIGDITSAFSGGSSSSLVQSIVSNYGSSLIAKLGVNSSMANTISSAIIPMVFKFINNKDDAPTSSDEGVKDLLGDLVGGSITDKLGGMLKNKFKF
ncbi:hypothetical protein BZG02_15435 [Labilibaculum filiforme]|uniref:DUF937 domain-containing protein n=1 Tax=Labilibaculum filiforme TaxID=1940526 RepID=A0A2N3HU40_9BACT|nr:hypothetical protein [Labilibaculum filiforme]PKQ61580.1 hypothetical protein BZG02_15435 [Labilibaculum filiforme]